MEITVTVREGEGTTKSFHRWSELWLWWGGNPGTKRGFCTPPGDIRTGHRRQAKTRFSNFHHRRGRMQLREPDRVGLTNEQTRTTTDSILTAKEILTNLLISSALRHHQRSSASPAKLPIPRSTARCISPGIHVLYTTGVRLQAAAGKAVLKRVVAGQLKVATLHVKVDVQSQPHLSKPAGVLLQRAGCDASDVVPV